MRLIDWTVKIFATLTVILILAAFFLHALQVPHHHFISLDINSNYHNHQHSAPSESNTFPGNLLDVPDYFHSGDKKDLLSILLSLASLASLVFLGWPKILIRLECEKNLKFKIALEKTTVVPYIKLLFSSGVLHPKVH